MASRNFDTRQSLERQVKSLFLKTTYQPTQATVSLPTTVPIVLTKAAYNSLYNGHTYRLAIAPAAANPTLSVLAVWTGSASATVLTITPNDGTNNPTTQASGSLATTTPVVLTKTVAAQAGVLGNGSTFTTSVLAAAANPTDKVLVTIAGTAAAMTCTITPNDGTNNPTTQASCSIPTATPIVLTKTVAAQAGVLGNGSTFTIAVDAAAPNPTDKILVAITGTAAAMTCTITPNDGTNNGATPVAFTSAELVSLINAGTLANVNLTDVSGLLNDQTATGGGAVAFADAGEGDGLVGTFASGANTAVTLTTANLVTLINAGTLANVNLTNAGGLLNDQTATGGDGTAMVASGEGDALTATFSGGVNSTVSLTTAEVVELINSGSVVGKTVSVTDGSSLRALATATGGGAQLVADGGEGDLTAQTFAGAIDCVKDNSYGISSVALTAAGTFRVTLDDAYPTLLKVNAIVLEATARDFTTQIKADAVAASKYFDLFTITAGTPATPTAGAKLMVSIDVKNTTV